MVGLLGPAMVLEVDAALVASGFGDVELACCICCSRLNCSRKEPSFFIVIGGPLQNSRIFISVYCIILLWIINSCTCSLDSLKGVSVVGMFILSAIIYVFKKNAANRCAN